jgi:hypothetical protein
MGAAPHLTPQQAGIVRGVGLASMERAMPRTERIGQQVLVWVYSDVEVGDLPETEVPEEDDILNAAEPLPSLSDLVESALQPRPGVTIEGLEDDNLTGKFCWVPRT